MMVEYEQDSNSVIIYPTESKEGKYLTRAYKDIQKILKYIGLKQKIQILDNEYFNTLKNFMAEEEELFQLVPHEIHRINAAKRHIQTWKNHFISGL